MLLGSLPGRSCINEYKALLNGDVIFTDAYNASLHARLNLDDKALFRRRLHKADSTYRATGRLEDYSDYAVMLVYTGNYQQAKKTLREIEQTLPGLYNTAANLGTVYELLGQNDSAFYWIKKAIEIDSASHHGSEWIHLKILEAKLKAKGDERYYSNHNILSLDFGLDEIPENKNNLDLKKLQDDLYYQLSERMSFIKPKDAIVAQLLFDLGTVTAMVRDVKSAIQIYESAKEYGYSSELFDRRLSYFKILQQEADQKNDPENIFGEQSLLIVFISGIGFIVLILIRRKKRKQKKT